MNPRHCVFLFARHSQSLIFRIHFYVIGSFFHVYHSFLFFKLYVVILQRTSEIILIINNNILNITLELLNNVIIL